MARSSSQSRGMRSCTDRAVSQGVTVLFTGLSSSGKTTTAMVLAQRLRGRTARPVEVLDGDRLRPSLGPDLGFTREDRIRFAERVAELAYEITAQGGIALCALVAPYDVARKRIRARIAEVGAFVLVHVATPLDVCEQRDDKGLYARARRRELHSFTGISDPYEPPHDADLTVDTSVTSAEDGASATMALLERRQLIEPAQNA